MQGEEEIYFVLPLQKAQFRLIPEVSSVVTVDMIQQDHSFEAVLNALKYRHPLKWLGKGAENLTVLCIPAREHRISYEQQVKPTYPTVIKIQKQGELSGYLSGRRSALLVYGDKLIRYKGCGNDRQGFVLQNDQLRGSHFIHTAKRQLFMTRLINDILVEEIGEPSANQPISFYEFPSSFGDSILRNDLPLFSKYCCVFQTRGDRRVGTHLISPLQILFLNIVDLADLDLAKFFTDRSRYDEFGVVQLLVDYELSLQNGQTFLQKYDQSKEFNNYTTLPELKQYQSKTIKTVNNFAEIIQKIGYKFNGQHSKIKELLSNEVDWIDIIRIILEKMGWEMGQVKRTFCQRGINWGFFNDHGYWHCNAHLNNFVITPPKNNSRLVLPLDFDLAFTQQQYINIDEGTPNYGLNDKADFQQLLLAEYNAMETSLSGVQVMNFKYSIEQAAKEPSLDVRMARVVFRDTLIRSFRWGMRKQKQEYTRINAEWNQNIPSIRRLVKICLQLSADFQT